MTLMWNASLILISSLKMPVVIQYNTHELSWTDRLNGGYSILHFAHLHADRTKVILYVRISARFAKRRL